MNTQDCAGCPNILNGIAFLHCSRCPDKYHYSCMNFSKKDFNKFDKDFKESWVCPTCRNKEPKRGDNTNTPVRSQVAAVERLAVDSAPSPSQPLYDNVTLRSKPRSSATCSCLSADLIREIIREELDRKFGTAIENINSKINKVEESLAFSNSELDSLKIESESLKGQILQLQKDNEQLRMSVSELSIHLRQLEQVSRSKNLEIQCVPEHNNENLYTTVQQLGSIIKCPITDTDLEYCSRIAKLNPASPRPRSVLVRFSSRRMRDRFLAGVIKYNKNNPSDKLNTSHLGIGGNKKTAVFVSEHLSAEAKALHAAARRKARELNYRFVWVRDGKVFVRKTDTSGFILIKDLNV